LIESIKATNFQSLQDVEIAFGKLTVIVGASSSGKSALTRAMKAVTSNSLDSDNITKGNRHSAVSLKTDNSTVTIERNTGDSSVYKIAKVGCEESRFARLNRQVPAEVTEALGILPSTQEVSSINFAGQFDTPYLLKEGSSSVARILGELTNVSVIFAAVKEASKRAKNASSLVNLRKKDQAKLVDKISDYASVGMKAKLMTSCEEKLLQASKLEAQISRLTYLLDKATMASQALSAIKEINEVPDVATLLEAQKKLNSYKSTLREIALARQLAMQQETSIDAAESAILTAEEELHATLVEVGTCPTCNQEIH
jgi:DNA repair exonuclease SbcCD ATPase subunit